MSETASEWENAEFSPILEHLTGLFGEKEKVVVDPQIDLKFREWADGWFRYVLQKLWPTFFRNWYQALIQVIATREDVRQIAATCLAIYSKAGKLEKWPGLTVAESGDVRVCLARSKFIICKGKDDKHYPILPKQENECILRFAQALLTLHPVLGMKLDQKELGDFIVANNTAHGLIADCWHDIIINFVAAIELAKLYDVPQIAEAEVVRRGSGKKPTPFLLARATGFKIFLRGGALMVMNEAKAETKAFIMSNPESVQELADLLSPYAELFFDDLPVTVPQVKQALFTLNPLSVDAKVGGEQ